MPASFVSTLDPRPILASRRAHRLVAAVLAVILAMLGAVAADGARARSARALAQTAAPTSTTPVVAVHVSERTAALETMPAGPGTPGVANGGTGHEWWITSWRYHVAYTSLEEALRSDGTAFVEVHDSDIAAGALLAADGSPRYPIVISLAAEAVGDDEIAPLRDYVGAGGFLFVGSSSMTRRPDGTSRNNFALHAEMGLDQVNASLQNWGTNTTLTKLVNHRLVADLPNGTIQWQGKPSAEANAYPDGWKWAWQVRPSGSDGAQAIASGEAGTLIATKPYGHGMFVYDAVLQPLVGDSGWHATAYAYLFYRRAIEWAFDSARLPIVKISPWQYPYDAAGIVRHDWENYASQIANIESSTHFEKSVGMKGDYYFTTGAIRSGSEDHQLTEQQKLDAQEALRRAVASDGATIGSHNGGLPNPSGQVSPPESYDYWHWGPDQALDTWPATVDGTDYATGKAYAKASLEKSFTDVEGWLAGTDNGPRTFASPYFNEAREQSHEALDELGVVWAGEQKVSIFPIRDFSYTTPGKHFGMVGMGVDNWYINGEIQQSIDGYLNTPEMEKAVDFFYDRGGAINLYGHNDLHAYVAYLSTKPNLWKTNALGMRDWFLKREPVHVTPGFTSSGGWSDATADITGATDAQTAIEVVLPGWSGATSQDVQVLLDGAPAPAGTWRFVRDGVKVQVGSAVHHVDVRYLPLTLFTQTNWSGHAGQAVWADASRYGSATDIDDTHEGQAQLAASSGGAPLYADDFNRDVPTETTPPFTWTVPATGAFHADTSGGVLSTSGASSYGYAYEDQTSMGDGSVEAKVRVDGTNLGGGVTARLNPATGAHYALWLYRNGDLKLIKFSDWTTWNTPGFWAQNLGNVSGWHTIKLTVTGDQLQAFYDGQLQATVTDPSPTATPGRAGVEFWGSPGPVFDDYVVTDDSGATLYADDFGPNHGAGGSLGTWNAVNGTWTLTGTMLHGVAPAGYANIHSTGFSTADSVTEARLRFAPGSSGGGVDTRVDPSTGARYGLWLYPAGSSDAVPNSVKLVKFTGWETWTQVPMATARMPIGTGDNDWYEARLEVVAGHLRASINGVPVFEADDPAPLGAGGVGIDEYTPSMIDVDAITVTTPAQYVDQGSLVSSAFDSGNGGWRTVSWTAGTPAGTSIRLRTRTADDLGALDSAPWSDWLTTSGSPIANPSGRWAQYEAGLATTTSSRTPMLFDVTLGYQTGDSAQPPANPPVAVVDNYTTAEGHALSVPAPGVLTNDTDPDGHGLTAMLVDAPSHGTVDLGPDGHFSYTPATGFSGSDGFTYTANAGTTASQPVAVTITVTAVNHAPVMTAPENQSTNVGDTVNLRIEAADQDADVLAFTAKGLPPGLTISDDGFITGSPTTANGSPFTVTVTVDDKRDGIAQKSFTWTVAQPNRAPVAVADAYSTDEDTALTVSAPDGVLANDSDADGDALHAMLVAGTGHGALTLNADGTFTYTPDAGFNGTDTFTYTTNDGTTVSAPAVVTITVAPANDPPVAVNNAYSISEDAVLTVGAPGVLANDTDPDGDVIHATMVASTVHGSLTLNADGSFTYTPATNFNGTDTFTYRAEDGSLSSAPATVTITVNAVNDAPVAINNAYSTNEDTALTVNAPGVLVNDTDADGDVLNATLFKDPLHGAVTMNADGSFTYIPATNFNGTDTFSYKARDASTSSGPATVTITVNAVNDAPVAVDNAYGTNQGTTLTVNAPGVLSNDTDADGDALSAMLAVGPANGTVALAPNGGFVYTPAASFNGTDTFTYRAEDASSSSAPATVTITVAPVTDGYRIVTADGQVSVYGRAKWFGSASAPKKPIVAMEATPTDLGYWLVASDGTVFPFGDAAKLGPGAALKKTIVGINATPSGKGFWLVASDGTVFPFGDAAKLGPGAALKKPIVGMSATPSGKGIWLVASDGTTFNYGDATPLGPTAALKKPIVGMNAMQTGNGYRLVASDGSVFAFGDAQAYGPASASKKPVVAID
jgi:VCBS repeat-containing protein